MEEKEDFYRAADNWVRLAQELLYLYRDTLIPKPVTLDEFHKDLKALIKFIKED